jgi:hypothetical protein
LLPSSLLGFFAAVDLHAPEGRSGWGERMKIEILYFDGCPSYQTLVPRLHEMVARLDADAAIELRHIETLDQAERERFLGSPTVRVDGADIEPTAAERTDFGLKCRLYRSEDATSSVPPEQWLREAIAAARTTG